MQHLTLYPKWRPRLNRYDVTHLVWRVLADQPCGLKLSSLRFRYPHTNHSTYIVAREPATSQDIKEVLIKRLLALGWKQIPNKHMLAWIGDETTQESRKCCLLYLGQHDITPMFCVRTPASLLETTT